MRFIRRYYTVTLLVGFAAIGCKEDAAIAEPVPRGRDPWVFYSTLDEHPRMLTLALREDVWASYDPERGVLYRVSPQSVQFEGAHDDTRLGPHPRTRGAPLLENAIEAPWRVRRGGDDTVVSSRLRGYRLEGDGVVLVYELTSPRGAQLEVEERPEVWADEAGRLELVRSFRCRALPPDTQVLLEFNAPQLASMRGVKLGAKVPELRGTLSLARDEDTALRIVLPPPQREKPPPKERTAERLMAESDCATCHNPTLRAVGPSFREIAHHYQTTPEIIAGLAVKLREGGAGQWGNEAMTAHPELDPADAELIARYILAHYDPDDGQGTEGTHPQGRDPHRLVEVDATELTAGIAVRVYELGHPLAALPVVAAETAPNTAFSTERLELHGATAYRRSEPSAGAFIRVESYLRITEAGPYDFQVEHDGLLALSIDDQPVLREDSSHAPRHSGWVSRSLQPGLRKFAIEQVSNAAEPKLALRWAPPSGRESSVPADRWHTRPVDPSAVAPGWKNYQLEPGVPGDAKPLEHVHPSFTVQSIRPRAWKPRVGGMDFLRDGRLALSTWDERGSVYVVDVRATDPERIEVKRFADGLAEPLGLEVVDGEVYVLQKHELTRLRDRDGDDVADDYRTISSGWGTTTNSHEFSFGLAYRDEHFYATLATAVAPGGIAAPQQHRNRGSVMQIARRTGEFEFLARGLRKPNGVGFGPNGALFVTDNHGDWLPANKLLHMQPAAYYGVPIVDPEHDATLPITPPVVWLPVDEIASSPSEPLLFDLGPYRDQMLVGDVTYGGLNRIVLQRSGETYQGCVLPFTQGLEAGVNRAVIGPDGAIYTGGIGSSGRGAQARKLWYGLQRLVYTGAPTFEMLDVQLRGDGIEVTFTEPVRVGDLTQSAEVALEQWRYEPTASYGGPKIDAHAVPIESVHISPDRRRVFIATRSLRTGYVVRVRFAYPPVAESGRELWASTGWCTVNAIPEQLGDRFGSEPAAPNTLTAAELADGWQLLFDGTSMHPFSPYRQQPLAASWRVHEGFLQTQGGSGPDLVSAETYENFELSYEWTAEPGANSGVFYRASTAHPELWKNAIEMQILDDQLAEDRHTPTHRAGSAYDLYAPRASVAKPAGDYNRARIVARGSRVEHWLNGHLVVAYDSTSPEFMRQRANSKFADLADFGGVRGGQIGLQHHGTVVGFRNIKIRRLD